MSKNNKQKTISVPEEVLGDMVKVYKKIEEFSDKFEDFAISNNQDILKELKKAREEHLNGDLEEFDLN